MKRPLDYAGKWGSFASWIALTPARALGLLAQDAPAGGGRLPFKDVRCPDGCPASNPRHDSLRTSGHRGHYARARVRMHMSNMPTQAYKNNKTTQPLVRNVRMSEPNSHADLRPDINPDMSIFECPVL